VSIVRILVVEDYEPFRRWVCSTLETLPDREVVGEVSNGLDAVRKADELQPDLVVLDIGLPGQDGLRAARQILKHRPTTKILFLTQYSSTDAIEEAFRIGGLGYVVKAHAGRELLRAVESVCVGRRFATKGLSIPADSDPPVHEVQFHADDASCINSFAQFVEPALAAGKTVIFLGTPARRAALRHRLHSDGVETETFVDQGRYIELDDAESLASFMDGDLIDEVRFHKGTTELLDAAMRAAIGTPPQVAACGDCAGVLWAEGKTDAAFQLERLWDEVGRAYGLDILCCYVVPDVLNARDEEFYERVRLMHAHAH